MVRESYFMDERIITYLFYWCLLHLILLFSHLFALLFQFISNLHFILHLLRLNSLQPLKYFCDRKWFSNEIFTWTETWSLMQNEILDIIGQIYHLLGHTILNRGVTVPSFLTCLFLWRMEGMWQVTASPCRGLNLTAAHVGFVANKVLLKLNFQPSTLALPCQSTFHRWFLWNCRRWCVRRVRPINLLSKLLPSTVWPCKWFHSVHTR